MLQVPTGARGTAVATLYALALVCLGYGLTLVLYGATLLLRYGKRARVQLRLQDMELFSCSAHTPAIPSSNAQILRAPVSLVTPADFRVHEEFIADTNRLPLEIITHFDQAAVIETVQEVSLSAQVERELSEAEAQLSAAQVRTYKRSNSPAAPPFRLFTDALRPFSYTRHHDDDDDVESAA